MILSGRQIRRELGKKIIIDPFNDEQLNPNSYNLRLGNELIVYQDEVLDMRRKPQLHNHYHSTGGLSINASPTLPRPHP